MTVIPRFFRPPVGSFFLFGPRGVGKTTWFRTQVPDALVLDLLVGARYRELSGHPERLRDLVAASASRDIVIDEIQRVPELLHSVHDLIETDRSRRFVLTGSSARKLRARGVNLLGGRAANRTLHPFLAAELGDGFDLSAALRHGLLPVVVSAPDPAVALDGYVSLYVDEKVRAEGLVRDVGRFARFLEAMSFSHGAALNLSGVARDAEARRPTVQGHLEILEDLLLSFRVPVFTKRAKRRLASHPKFFFFDCGVYRALRRTGPSTGLRRSRARPLKGSWRSTSGHGWHTGTAVHGSSPGEPGRAPRSISWPMVRRNSLRSRSRTHRACARRTFVVSAHSVTSTRRRCVSCCTAGKTGS